MYVCIFNVCNFINSTVIFMKYGDKTHIISIVLLALTGVCYLILIRLFYYDPKSFGYFYNSFNSNSLLATKQYFIYPAILIITIVLLTILP